MVAGCICPAGAEVDTLGIQIATNGKHKAVLLYDTEQSEVQLFKNVSNLLARAKQPDKPEELKAFCLTGMSVKNACTLLFKVWINFITSTAASSW